MDPDLGSQLLSTHQGCRCSFSVPDTGPEQLKDLGKYQLVPLVQLWSQFSPKMLSAGISVPRFTVAGRGAAPTYGHQVGLGHCVFWVPSAVGIGTCSVAVQVGFHLVQLH